MDHFHLSGPLSLKPAENAKVINGKWHTRTWICTGDPQKLWITTASPLTRKIKVKSPDTYSSW
jgi:hypothetical protein